MTVRSDILDTMIDLPGKKILKIAHTHGAISVRIFGSRARGDARPDSDLDLLITTAPGTSLLDLGAMQQELEDLLGVRVDIVTEGGLRHPRLREYILAEAKPLVAA